MFQRFSLLAGLTSDFLLCDIPTVTDQLRSPPDFPDAICLSGEFDRKQKILR